MRVDLQWQTLPLDLGFGLRQQPPSGSATWNMRVAAAEDLRQGATQAAAFVETQAPLELLQSGEQHPIPGQSL